MAMAAICYGHGSDLLLMRNYMSIATKPRISWQTGVAVGTSTRSSGKYLVRSKCANVPSQYFAMQMVSKVSTPVCASASVSASASASASGSNRHRR
ncbi:hypothetical protein ACMFMF_011484 [Clarireedia jacksonii]